MLDQLSNGAPVCAVILLLIVAISVSALSYAPQLIEKNLFRPYWMPRKHQYYTLISSAFIHADYGHLIFNALTLWSFGFAVEREIGSTRFFVLYVVGLLASGFGTYFKQRKNPDYACLGASGAILAVLFASIVYFPTRSIYILPLPVPIPAPLYAVGFLAYTWFAARSGRGRINHDAHMDGALAGLAFVALTDFGAYWRLWQMF